MSSLNKVCSRLNKAYDQCHGLCTHARNAKRATPAAAKRPIPWLCITVAASALEVGDDAERPLSADLDAVGNVPVLEPSASVADGLELPVTLVEVADWVVDSEDVLVEVELSLAQLALWGRSFTPAPLQILWANSMVSEREEGREVSEVEAGGLDGRHHLPFCLSAEHLVATQHEMSVRNDLVEQMHLISIMEQVSGMDPVAHSFCCGHQSLGSICRRKNIVTTGSMRYIPHNQEDHSSPGQPPCPGTRRGRAGYSEASLPKASTLMGLMVGLDEMS